MFSFHKNLIVVFPKTGTLPLVFHPQATGITRRLEFQL
jgi:hypothetical protein